MDPIQIDLTSIAGVIALTVAIVGGLKPLVAKWKITAAIPTVVYVVVVAAVLTFVANALGILQGSRWDLVGKAIAAALAAVGLRETIVQGRVATPVGDSQK